MNRTIYTYTDLTKINESKNFTMLMKYPQITVSADLRKSLTGKREIDKVKGLVADNSEFKVSEFNGLITAIDGYWNTDQCKFQQMTFLSEFMNKKIRNTHDAKEKNWLIGCQRNLDSILASIVILEQANIKPQDFKTSEDRNIAIFIEAWEYLIEKDSSIKNFRKRVTELTTKAAWSAVLGRAFKTRFADEIDTIVFHGFYYITPFQERIMSLLEGAGFNIIYLIPYDDRYPYAYQVFDEIYSEDRGFAPKESWHIEKSEEADPYGEIFEGRTAHPNNNLVLKEYASVMEFVEDVEHIKSKGYSLYSAEHKNANNILKDYYPDDYGDRKILSYPIGHFIGTLNKLWDSSVEAIVIEEEDIIKCFSSGWLAVDGLSGKQYIQELMYMLPFFKDCRTVSQWEHRILLYKEIQESVLSQFEEEPDSDEAVSRWQKAIGSPLKNFSIFAVDSAKADIILKLIKQLINMAKTLYGSNEAIHLQHHISTLDHILKTHEMSHEMYDEEREIIKDIFEKLSSDNVMDAVCRPSDIAVALDLFICGKYEEGDEHSDKVGLVYPLHFVDSACVKNNSKVHLCLSDVNSLPGGAREYIWPLTEKSVKSLYETTGNPLVLNLMQNVEIKMLCNRYMTYCALKNKDVTLSWVSNMGEKKLAPSPYIKLLSKALGIRILPPLRDSISFEYVNNSPYSKGRITDYDNDLTPQDMPKEVELDYALCPMKYILGYVVEKFPTFQSDFQMKYALNALISALYDLMKDDGTNVDEIYEAVVALFPNMRKVEKRQVYDYISDNDMEDDLDYAKRTECGSRQYSNERLKVHYPNYEVRRAALLQLEKIMIAGGRKGIDIYEQMSKANICTFCQHVSYCINARYEGNQENYYD